MLSKNETGVPTLDKRVRNNPDKDNVTTANQDALADFTHAREEYTYQSTVTASKAEKLDYQFISKLPHITSSTTYLLLIHLTNKMDKRYDIQQKCSHCDLREQGCSRHNKR